MRKIAADDVFPGVGGMERYGKIWKVDMMGI
jgi:hypothetical protein